MLLSLPRRVVVDQIHDLVLVALQEVTSQRQECGWDVIRDSLTSWTHMFPRTRRGRFPRPSATRIYGAAVWTQRWTLYFAFGMIRVVIELANEPIVSFVPQVIFLHDEFLHSPVVVG